MLISVIIAVLAAVYLYIMIRRDLHNFVVRVYDVYSPKIRKETSFCLLSDLHEKDYGDNNRCLRDEIDVLRPDFILSAGDLLTAHRRPSRCTDTAAAGLLEALAKKYPVYVACGNHETKLAGREDLYGDYYGDYERKLREAGVQTLHNHAPEAIADDMDLAALELDTTYYSHGRQKPLVQQEITDAIGVPDGTRFTVLLAHEPGRFRAYGEWGADLVLSGHVHGGVIRVPYQGVISPSLMPMPFYDGGAYLRRTDPHDTGKPPEEKHIHFAVRHPDGQMIYLEENLHAMIISRGLGTHTIHVRFNNPGELVYVRLHPAEGAEKSAARQGITEDGAGSQAAGV